jgi:gliding motility-associated-like protein
MRSQWNGVFHRVGIVLMIVLNPIVYYASSEATISIQKQEGNRFELTLNLHRKNTDSPSGLTATINCSSASCHLEQEIIITQAPSSSEMIFSGTVEFPNNCPDWVLRYSYLKQPEHIYFSLNTTLNALVAAGETGLRVSETPATASYEALVTEAREQHLPDSELPGYLQYRSRMNAEILLGSWNRKIPQLPLPAGSSCTNADFETGNLSGWNGLTGLNPGCCLTPGFISGRQTITSGPGLDPCGGFPVVCPGGSYSLQLGANISGGLAEQVTQTFTVSATSTNFTYKYAVVLEDPGHPLSQQPFFQVDMLDQTGAEIPCALYFVAAGQGIPGFQNSSTCAGVIFKPWTSVSIDLSAYVGQSVTVRFTAADCTLGGHFGYAYIDGTCLPLSLTASANVCQGNNVTLSAPTGSAAYYWSPGGQTTQVITVNTSGTYSCTLTSVQGCSVTLSVPAIIYPAPVAAIGIIHPQCSASYSFTDSSLVSSGSIVSANWDFGDLTSSSAANPVHVYSSPGSYTVTLTVTTSEGCNASATSVVDVPIPVQTLISSSNVSCFGGNNGAANVIVSGGQSPYTYSWSNATSGFSTSNLSVGTYSLNATDSKGCSASGTFTITQPPVLSAVTSSNNPVCFGLSTGLASVIATGGTAGYTYSWNCNPVQTTQTATGLAAGSYNCTITDNHGCTLSVPAILTQPTALAANVNGQNARCNGSSDASAIVGVTGGTAPYTYYWNSSPVQFTASVVNLPAALYSVTVLDHEGCSVTASITLTQPTPLALTILSVNNVTCYGGTNGSAVSALSGGTAPYTYSWNTTPSQQTAAANNLLAGAYLISVLDANHCTSAVSAVITQPAKLTSQVPTSANPLCYGGTNGNANGIVSGGTLPYTYSWNSVPAQFTASATNLSAGTYSFTATDGNGCVSVSTLLINQPTPLQVTHRSGSPVCYGVNSGWITSSVSGGTPTYLYSWNTSGSQTSGLTGLSAGSYFLNIIDANGCTVSDSVQLTQPAQLSSIVLVSNETCFGGNNAWMQAGPTGGRAPYLYSWNTVPPQSGTSISGLTAGTYSLSITDKNGCSISSSGTVVQPAPILVQAVGSTTICAGQIASLFVQASGGNGSYTYSWNNGVGVGSSQIVNPAISTVYNVQVTDNAGCKGPPDSVSIDVIVLGAGNLHVTPSSGICIGGSTVLSAAVTGSAGVVSYSWSNMAGSGNGPGPYTVNPVITTTYSIVVTNSCGVSENAAVTITVNPLPVISLTPQKIASCSRLPVTMMNNATNPGASYFWSSSDGWTSSLATAIHTYSETGLYTVTLVVTSAQGCVSSGITDDSITVFPPSIASFYSVDQISELTPTIQFTNTSINALHSSWDFGDNRSSIEFSPAHTYPGKGTYAIVLMTVSPKGCMDTARKKIEIIPEFSYYIPNAFTPNGDGVNDIFNGKGEEVADFSMMIFDRWGGLIYTNTDKEKGWDGRANNGNEIAQIDVYVYKISLHDFRGIKHDYLGSVSLIK